jgi:SAM-dependent methyltransferase
MPESVTRPYSRRVVPPLTFQAWLRWDTVERLLPDDATTVLEIGAGMGTVGALLARRFDYVALEPDAASFAVARRRIEAAGGRAEQRDFADISRGRTFDLVCAFEVLEHLEDEAAALAAWHGLVRPGGRLLLSVPGAPRMYGASDERAGHFRRYDRSSLRAVLEQAGFEDVQIAAYGFPVGYPLKLLRDALAGRELRREEGTRTERTASSGRWLQPGERLAPLTWAAALPFRYLQRPFAPTALGTGLVASARRRLRSNE